MKVLRFCLLGCWQKRCHFWVRDRRQCNTHSNSRNQSIIFFLCWFSKPQFPQGGANCPRRHLYSFKFRKLQSFIIGHKQNCNLCLGKGFIFILLDSQQTSPVLQKERLPLSSQAVLNADILGKITEQRWSLPRPARWGETRETGNYLWLPFHLFLYWFLYFPPGFYLQLPLPSAFHSWQKDYFLKNADRKNLISSNAWIQWNVYYRLYKNCMSYGTKDDISQGETWMKLCNFATFLVDQGLISRLLLLLCPDQKKKKRPTTPEKKDRESE